jgi:hypothetical protein
VEMMCILMCRQDPFSIGCPHLALYSDAFSLFFWFNTAPANCPRYFLWNMMCILMCRQDPFSIGCPHLALYSDAFSLFFWFNTAPANCPRYFLWNMMCILMCRQDPFSIGCRHRALYSDAFSLFYWLILKCCWLIDASTSCNMLKLNPVRVSAVQLPSLC